MHRTDRQGDGRLSDEQKSGIKTLSYMLHTHVRAHTIFSLGFSLRFLSFLDVPTQAVGKTRTHKDCRPMQMAAVLHIRPLTSAKLRMEG